MISPELSDRSEFPDSTLQQLSNFKLAREKLSLVDTQISTLLKLLLLGMLTLIPDVVEESGILEDSKHLETTTSLLRYQVALNDWLDFSLSRRTDIQSALLLAANSENSAYHEATGLLSQTCSPKQIELVQQSLKEITTIEVWAATKQDWTLAEAIEYRNLVNAVSNVLLTTVTLKFPQNLVEKLESDSAQSSMDDIRTKYSWILQNQFENRLEQTVLIMHNLAMAGQIDDDKFGQTVDGALNLHSVALVAQQKIQDPAKIKQVLDQLKNQYLETAQKLGLSSIAVRGIDFAQSQVIQKPMAWMTHSRESNTSIWRNGMLRRAQMGYWPFQKSGQKTSVGLRERLYVAREI